MPSGEKSVSKYDWVAEYSAFTNAHLADDRITLKNWCKERKLNYSNFSTHFAELSRLQVAEIGATLAPRAMRKLGELMNSKDENISLKTSTSILDRTGHSPKEQTVNVQTNISLGVSLFSKEDGDKIKTMFGGNVIDEKEPGDQ